VSLRRLARRVLAAPLPRAGSNELTRHAVSLTRTRIRSLEFRTDTVAHVILLALIENQLSIRVGIRMGHGLAHNRLSIIDLEGGRQPMEIPRAIR
jgi:hypothetical protein